MDPYPPAPPPPQGMHQGNAMQQQPSERRSAPFSVHSRGVQLFDSTRCCDPQFCGLSIFRSLRDISGALWTFLIVQGWLSVWVTIITVVSVFFFTYISGGRTQAIDWTVAAFIVFLPLVGNLWWAYERRERALTDLAQVKVLLQHIALAHRDWLPLGVLPASHLQESRALLSSLVDGMRLYFLPPRFYSTEFPYAGLKLKMMRVAQDRAKQVRAITLAFHALVRSSEALRKAGLGEANLAQLAAWNLALQTAFERMANIKEYRTPVGLRALARCYVALLIPVFFGPYYANLRHGIGTAFAVVLAIVMNVATVGVLHVAMALEDPFDNQGLDGIYVDEALFEAQQAILFSEEDYKAAAQQQLLGDAASNGMPGGPRGGNAAADSLGGGPAGSPFQQQQRSGSGGKDGSQPHTHSLRDPGATVGDSVNELPSADVEAPPHH